MESNIFNLIKIYPIIIISLTYCYWIRTFIQPGTKRLVCLLPIICLNLFIPLTFTSVHLTELEPQFNNPILATSLQDFWGRRWNLMVTSIMRPTVYEPTLKVAKNLVGVKWAPLVAVFGTFVVSGLMHELILFYLGRLEPTFRMFGFFVFHGVCLTVEIALKKVVTDRWQLPRFVSGPLTVGFFFATCFWLFLPEFIRCKVDVMAFEEYAALGVFVRNLTSAY
ncbi:hypothetical protein P8452_36110 [Trifolium repens]|nr:hypothetical protein P8452_36110 [Trifolium repens]